MMRPHVGMSAAGVLAIVAPPGEEVVDPARAEDRIVGPQGRGAEPEVPVQAWLRLLGGQVAPLARAAHAHGDRLDLAETAAADEFRRLPEGPEHVGSLLAAGLEDPLVFPRDLDDALALGERQRQGLFAIDVLARLHRLDGRDHMPVLRRGDADGVDVLPPDQIAEVRVGGADMERGLALIGLLDAPLGVLSTRPVHLADGQRLDVAKAQQLVKMVVIGHIAAADEPDCDPLTGRGLVVPAEDAAGHDRRHGKRAGGKPSEEVPAREVACWCHLRVLSGCVFGAGRTYET